MRNYNQLLEEINMPNLKFLGKGMQSLVFELNEREVLKVYGREIGIENIKRLKNFYESLDTKKVSFLTPLLTDVVEKGAKILATEKKLDGICPNGDYLKKLNTADLRRFLYSYIETLFSVQKIETTYLGIAEVLDLTGDFFEPRLYKDWNELITFNLKNKYQQTKTIFDKKVDNAARLVEMLVGKFSSYKISKSRLIHGDFFPANLMVDDSLKIASVLDFGILTTIGDPIFDIALGATFSDMYDQIKHFKVKEFVWGLVKDKVTEEEYIRAQVYVLIYSFISANMYKKNDPTDGHFNWCINNLNNPKLLKYL